MEVKTNFYTITAYTSICHVTQYSSWDERVMADYVQDRNEVVSRIYKGKKWAILMDMRHWTLHTPGAENSATQLIKKTSFQRADHTAYIVGNSELKKWQIHKTVVKTGMVNVKYVETLDEGKHWLTSLGYEMTSLD